MARLFACFVALVNHMSYEERPGYDGMATATAGAVVMVAAVAGFVRMAPIGNHRAPTSVKAYFGNEAPGDVKPLRY